MKKSRSASSCFVAPDCFTGMRVMMDVWSLMSSSKGEVVMTTPAHCPGFEKHKNLSSFLCKCPECGKEKEIFSDEFHKTHICPECKKEIDFTRCTLEASA